ncbi:YadA-like family protein [Parvularcula dongshanensis]|uniref:Autotransporter adhesin n=1 Tax=Parvularcula dongshanensis TaxID=1173995 RepID=A0A840I1X8_9PROT|nr:YadA-like family protein [Parvularcula dongshanensis]MBB4658262.1 autotransporter adhesin [Parvularcula dongshanensis]
MAEGLGGGAAYDEEAGEMTGPTYEINGVEHRDVGSALLALSRTGGGLTPLAYAASSEDGSAVSRVTDDAVLVGLSGGPVRLHNVARGRAATDAVNVSQLSDAVLEANNYTDAWMDRLAGQLGNISREADAGTATAIAAAQLPQPMRAGRSMFAVGIGYYNGQNGAAMGYSRSSRDGNRVVRVSGSYNSQKKLSLGAGAGFEF